MSAFWCIWPRCNMQIMRACLFLVFLVMLVCESPKPGLLLTPLVRFLSSQVQHWAPNSHCCSSLSLKLLVGETPTWTFGQPLSFNLLDCGALNRGICGPLSLQIASCAIWVGSHQTGVLLTALACFAILQVGLGCGECEGDRSECGA